MTTTSTFATDLDVVKAFYTKLLSSPSAPEALTRDDLYSVLSEDYVGDPTPPAGPGAEGVFNTIMFFGEAVPDLTWEPQEILQHGNRYTVRARATGTPVGPFLGVEPATGRGFDVMSIDILTVEDGRVVHAYHVEDWATAIAQLTATD